MPECEECGAFDADDHYRDCPEYAAQLRAQGRADAEREVVAFLRTPPGHNKDSLMGAAWKMAADIIERGDHRPKKGGDRG